MTWTHASSTDLAVRCKSCLDLAYAAHVIIHGKRNSSRPHMPHMSQRFFSLWLDSDDDRDTEPACMARHPPTSGRSGDRRRASQPASQSVGRVVGRGLAHSLTQRDRPTGKQVRKQLGQPSKPGVRAGFPPFKSLSLYDVFSRPAGWLASRWRDRE